jgi:FMN reductase
VTQPDDHHVTVVAIDGSPSRGGRTAAALNAVCAAATAAGASIDSVALEADGSGVGPAVERLMTADAAVLSSPVHRATFAAPLKQLLDAVPRSGPPSLESALRAKAVAIVHTGASLHHFLALDVVRCMLAGFFAAHVVPPGLYVPHEGFNRDLALKDPYSEHARLQGTALVALAQALRASPALSSLRPQS